MAWITDNLINKLIVRHSGHGLNNRPFHNRKCLDHSNTGLVRYSDPHCIYKPFCVVLRVWASTCHIPNIFFFFRSLGVVLYVLVSGTLPFDAPTLLELRDRVIKCQYRVPFFLSNDCELLLKGLLVIEPEKRLNLDQIARHPWTVSSKGRENPSTAQLLDVINSRAVIDCATSIQVRHSVHLSHKSRPKQMSILKFELHRAWLWSRAITNNCNYVLWDHCLVESTFTMCSWLSFTLCVLCTFTMRFKDRIYRQSPVKSPDIKTL